VRNSPAVSLLDKYNLMVSPIYLDFLQGGRELEMHAWGTPTFNPRGWKGPATLSRQSLCVLPEMIDQPLGKLPAPGTTRAAPNCMMHGGFGQLRAGRKTTVGRHLDHG